MAPATPEPVEGDWPLDCAAMVLSAWLKRAGTRGSVKEAKTNARVERIKPSRCGRMMLQSHLAVPRCDGELRLVNDIVGQAESDASVVSWLRLNEKLLGDIEI